MPKALVIDDDDMPRRRGRSKPADVDVDVERNLLLRVLLHSPKDTVAGVVALGAIVAIIANAMFMQPGRHPAPMFHMSFPAAAPAPAPSAPAPVAASPASSSSALPPVSSSPLPRPRPAEAEPRSEAKPVEIKPAESAPMPAKAVPAHAPANAAHAPAANVARPPAPIPASNRNDPVGDLIVSTRRIAAVQRALTDFGYGQLKPTGVAGTDTQTAIQKFERERKLPVTGQISDRLVRELSVVTGRTID